MLKIIYQIAIICTLNDFESELPDDNCPKSWNPRNKLKSDSFIYRNVNFLGQNHGNQEKFWPSGNSALD